MSGLRTGFTNLRSFNISLEKAYVDSLGELVKRQKALSFKAFGSIVHNTPVDKGRLKGGWNMSISTPDDRIPPAGESSYQPSMGSLAGLKAFDVVYINNALPYAVAIEDGHGGRAPGVMVQHTVNVLENEATVQ